MFLFSRWIPRCSARTFGTTNRVRIYTKTGDRGQSSLFSGTRRPKDNAIFQALGSIDELNSILGMVRARWSEESRGGDMQSILSRRNALDSQVCEIQSRLFDLGALVATPPTSSSSEKQAMVVFEETHVSNLESWIDHWDESLPPLRNFILPGGAHGAAEIHLARAMCRRAERDVVIVVREDQVPDVAQRFLNRLSDYLFVIARIISADHQIKETLYIRAKTTESASS